MFFLRVEEAIPFASCAASPRQKYLEIELVMNAVTETRVNLMDGESMWASSHEKHTEAGIVNGVLKMNSLKTNSFTCMPDWPVGSNDLLRVCVWVCVCVCVCVCVFRKGERVLYLERSPACLTWVCLFFVVADAVPLHLPSCFSGRLHRFDQSELGAALHDLRPTGCV